MQVYEDTYHKSVADFNTKLQAYKEGKGTESTAAPGTIVSTRNTMLRTPPSSALGADQWR